MKLILFFLLLIFSGSIVFAQKVGVIRLSAIADIDTINIVRTDWVAFLVNNSPIRTLSTTGAVGNVSISGGNSITLNVNDHSNRTALDAVSGTNTGDQNQLINSVSYSNNILEIQESGNVWQTEIISSSSEADIGGYFNTEFEPTTSYSMTFPMNMNTPDYFLWLRAYRKEFINGDSVQVSVAMKNLQKTLSGFSVDLKSDSCYVTYLAMDTLDWKLFTFENYVTWADTATMDTFGIIKPDGTTVKVASGILSTYIASATQLGSVKVDGISVQINPEGVISVVGSANFTQTLTGLTPAFNIANGLNATLTLSGNTTITMSGLYDGSTGTLTVTNGSSPYTLNVSNGFNNGIAKNIGSPSNYTKLNVTGISAAVDSYSYKYSGGILTWQGNLDLIIAP